MITTKELSRIEKILSDGNVNAVNAYMILNVIKTQKREIEQREAQIDNNQRTIKLLRNFDE